MNIVRCRPIIAGQAKHCVKQSLCGILDLLLSPTTILKKINILIFYIISYFVFIYENL